ncbi:zinc dependent phospholipase C family protein [Radiobacillus kanasensis]|uniref:zinc dependent phospholipase C family protein n=1 Tax=Radiobacillus kanasensis TaxID=2844358 RepID=UPI001E5CF52A|nr:zinc dependent phospholipase C family protein [Radiobacillus kanasensis]UFU00460.1 zinc dependent phospholipase C family protein [Radiobacillus kanasensis]
MPNIWTHILFCDELLETINEPSCGEHETYLNLGAQGPDPFFYHNFLPWKKDKKVNQIGTLLHTEQCGDFLTFLIQKAPQYGEKAKAYVLGFVTHHILDRNTHPYIHYKAGYERNNHQYLEVIIDTIMMNRFRNQDTWKFAVYKEIDVGHKLDEDVNQLMKEAIQTHFPEAVSNLSPDYVKDSYRDMKRALMIVSDSTGLKNVFLSSLISSFSHRPIKEKKDYLGEERNTWYHPATKEPSTKSFVDLYEEGKIEGTEVLKELLKYWESPTENQLSKLQALLDDISYDTGTPASMRHKPIYSDPIV